MRPYEAAKRLSGWDALLEGPEAEYFHRVLRSQMVHLATYPGGGFRLGYEVNGDRYAMGFRAHGHDLRADLSLDGDPVASLRIPHGGSVETQGDDAYSRDELLSLVYNLSTDRVADLHSPAEDEGVRA